MSTLLRLFAEVVRTSFIVLIELSAVCIILSMMNYSCRSTYMRMLMMVWVKLVVVSMALAEA